MAITSDLANVTDAISDVNTKGIIRGFKKETLASTPIRLTVYVYAVVYCYVCSVVPC